MKKYTNNMLILILAMTILTPMQAMGADAQALVDSINQRLAILDYTTVKTGTTYANQWQNRYQLTIDGNSLSIAYTEDITFLKDQQFKDRYRESGSYTVDLGSVNAEATTIAPAGDRLDIVCQTGQQCVSKQYDGNFLRQSGAVRSDRQGTESVGGVSLFIGPVSLLDQAFTEVDQLIRQLVGQ